MVVSLFIDGDNVKCNKIKFSSLFKKINEENKNINLKRIYCDWKDIQMQVFWDKYVHEYGLDEVHISRLSGKNSTDNKIIVDVMDCLYNKPFIEKYILLGCDKDYIPVIRKVIESNKKFEVYGLKNQTSLNIINCCTKYYDLNEYIDTRIAKTITKTDNIINDITTKIDELVENNDENVDVDEEIYKPDDQIYKTLNKFINFDGICVSELKKNIKKENKRELFGKNFHKIDIFIKTHYSHKWEIVRDWKNGTFIIKNK
jgi:uncharacterized LabA/DUF88 family protein